MATKSPNLIKEKKLIAYKNKEKVNKHIKKLALPQYTNSKHSKLPVIQLANLSKILTLVNTYTLLLKQFYLTRYGKNHHRA